MSALLAAGCPIEACLADRNNYGRLFDLLNAACRKSDDSRIGPWPPLFLAALHGHAAAVGALLAAGAAVHMPLGIPGEDSSIYDLLLQYDRAKDVPTTLRLLLTQRPDSTAAFEAAVCELRGVEF